MDGMDDVWWDALGLHLHPRLPATCDLLLRSTFSVVASWAIMAPHHLVDSSLEAVIAHSTTQARFPEIQDSALTDLTTVLGDGVRSAAGYPGRIQERWRWSPQSVFLVPANWTALFRLRRESTDDRLTSQQPSPTLPLKVLT
jgi:hypothetical protein